MIIAPSSLHQQRKQELEEKFAIPAILLDASNRVEHLGPKGAVGVLICSYEFAQRDATRLSRPWDMVVADEAHRMCSHWTGKRKSPLT